MDSPFWESLSVYYLRPNILNKRIAGSVVDHAFHIPREWSAFNGLLDRILQIRDSGQLCAEFSKYANGSKFILPVTDCFQLLIRTLLPKRSLKENESNRKHPSIEAMLADFVHQRVAFIPLENASHLLPSCAYTVESNEDRTILLHVLEGAEEDQQTEQAAAAWLQDNVRPKLQKWADNAGDESISGGKNSNTTIKSHQLIDESSYCLLYDKLKMKHAPALLEMWPKVEKTDPKKFVYEDIAIASYLLCLWEQERTALQTTKKQTFLDLGCGNGLLVYLLMAEGHRGVGIDVRKRNVWDHYPEPKPKLVEKTLAPCIEMMVDVGHDADWLIGNHSDELTPWIPVSAAKASSTMRIFLLPCCPYDFDGKKYQRKLANCSQYASYMRYVGKLCADLNYDVSIDKLKIPSTKRTCFVCRPALDTTKKPSVAKVEELIMQKLISKEVKIRKPVEEIRNCTSLPRERLNEAIDRIAKILIAKGSVTIPELPPLLGKDTLDMLKNQCGGLQTLLRNHKYIFQIDNRNIRFAAPKTIDEVSEEKRSNLKSKPCWLHSHHPSGCPLTDERCCYKHEKKQIELMDQSM